MSRTKLSTHHSYDSSFVLVGAESQKRELRTKRRRKTKKSLVYVRVNHSFVSIVILCDNDDDDVSSSSWSKTHLSQKE